MSEQQKTWIGVLIGAIIVALVIGLDVLVLVFMRVPGPSILIRIGAAVVFSLVATLAAMRIERLWRNMDRNFDEQLKKLEKESEEK
jgi:hypothetical protein